METKRRLTLANEVAELARLAGVTEAFLEAHSVPPGPSYKVQLALEEVVTNVIKYGFDDDGAHEIEVSMAIQKGSIELAVQDDGHEFDPLRDAPSPDLELSLEERSIGGLGLHLVRQMVDRVTYQRQGNCNRIEMSVALEIPESA